MIISFNTCSFNLFILLGTPIFATVSFLFRNLIFENKDTDKHPLYIVLSMCFGQFMTIILDFIVISKTTKNSRAKLLPKKHKRIAYVLFQNTNSPQTKLCDLSNMILFALCGFYDILSTLGILMTSVYVFSIYREYETKVFLIVSSVLLSRLFFKYPIFKHQIVGIVFIIIGEVTVYSFDAPYEYIDFLYLIWYLLLSLVYIISKWLMEEKFVTPFRLVGYRGLFGIIMVLAGIGISENIPCRWRFCTGLELESFSYFITLGSDIKLLGNYLLFALICFILNVGYEMINKIYNPNHLAVSGTFSSILQIVIISLVKLSEFKWKHLIGNSLILVGCIFYNELIIFHFFGLDYNTRKVIEKRSKAELSEVGKTISLTDNTEIESINSLEKSSNTGNNYSKIVIEESL